jgi:small conductance mechanosensitive channel
MIPLLLKLMTYLAYFGVGVIVLQEAGFDPLPILAGAGVVGIAVGLGAQDMMKDIISGFSILFEGYYLIGDYVKIDGYEGYVVELDILNTRLRDENGQVHIIRNGKVSSVSNFSKEYTNAVVEILVALETDLDHVERIVKEVGEEVTADEYVLEPTMIDGVLSIDAAGILIRTVTRVAPGKHKVVGRRVRQVLKRSLDRENIETPYSHHIIEHKNPKS